MNESMTVITGGQEIVVAYKNGESEAVKVRQLPVKLMPQFGKVIDNDALAVELYCDKPPGWSEKLTNESFNAVADLGLDLNSDFFSAWFQRRMKIAEALRPGSAAEIRKGLSAVVQNTTPEAKASDGSSQKLPFVAA